MRMKHQLMIVSVLHGSDDILDELTLVIRLDKDQVNNAQIGRCKWERNKWILCVKSKAHNHDELKIIFIEVRGVGNAMMNVSHVKQTDQYSDLLRIECNDFNPKMDITWDHVEGMDVLCEHQVQRPSDTYSLIQYKSSLTSIILEGYHQNNTETLEALLKSAQSSGPRLEHTIQGENGRRAFPNTVKELAMVNNILQSMVNHDVTLLIAKNINANTATGNATLDTMANSEDAAGSHQELVIARDEPCKDAKPSEDNNELAPYYGSGLTRFTRGMSQILLPSNQFVTTGSTDHQTISQVYQIPNTELQAKQFSEAERLTTFESGFNSKYMTATSLARAGLINMKTDRDDVVCVWCLVQFRNFKATVDAVALHFAYSVKVCEFIKRFSKMNVPIAGKQLNELGKTFLHLSTIMQESPRCKYQRAMDEAQQGASAVQQYIMLEKRTESLLAPSSMRAVMVNDPHIMRYEQMRLISFVRKGWANFYAEHLAMAGFYLEKDINGKFTIACPFCDGKITDVPKDTIPMFTKEKDHTPLQVHILKFPACAFIQGNNLGTRSNVPMIAGEFRWNQSKVVTSAQANVGSELVTMGVATTQADCPPMAVYERRCESFLTLPYDHHKGAEDLATCGFYNLGTKQKCFWCGVECGSWSSGEDVWARHARSMRSCQFVINEKGAEFVTHVREEHGEWIDSQRDEDRIRNVTTCAIKERMDFLVVQKVISMGYTRDRVKNAIINRLKELKPDYTSVEDLIFDVLALRKGNRTYHRDLKLPDVPVSPKSAMSEYEEEDTDTEEEDDSECAAAGNQSHQEENPPDTHFHGNSYPINSNKQVGLIVPNPIDRDGHVAESSTMEDALRHSGFDVMRVEWTNRKELMTAIVSRIKATESQCDLFLVFISSHGNIGHLKCSDGSLVAINDILDTISKNIAKHIPLVVIIQACMGYTCDDKVIAGTDPASEYANTDSTVNRHVEATRPHTVILWATVNGKSAVRGAYPREIAAQIHAADNKTSLYSMHIAATIAMAKKVSSQTPRWESTLTRQLILPGKDIFQEKTMAAELMTKLTCKVCRTSTIGIIFLPCGHFVCCTSCAPAMTQCPTCRQDIDSATKAAVC